MQAHSRMAFTYSSMPALALRNVALDVLSGRTRYPAAPTPGRAHAELRILIVNEDMRSAESLKHALHDLGYHTTLTAYSAKRALVAACDFFPSLALLDLELPDMSGFELAERLRTHGQKSVRHVPLVAVAECDSFASSDLARAAGFVGHLTKPVRPWALNDLLQGLWR